MGHVLHSWSQSWVTFCHIIGLHVRSCLFRRFLRTFISRCFRRFHRRFRRFRRTFMSRHQSRAGFHRFRRMCMSRHVFPLSSYVCLHTFIMHNHIPFGGTLWNTLSHIGTLWYSIARRVTLFFFFLKACLRHGLYIFDTSLARVGRCFGMF